MKFLLATGIYPPEIGGPATAIEALATELRARGHKVTIVTYGDGERGAEVVTVSRRGNTLARYLRFAGVVRRKLEQDTVLLATDVFSVGIPVRLALIGKCNRFLLRLGGEWFWEDSVERGRDHRTLRDFWQTSPHGLHGWLVRQNYCWILSRAEKVIVTAGLLRDILSAAFPAFSDRLVVASNIVPVNCSKISHEAHTPLRLVYVGRFARVKNVPFLARVIRSLADQGTPVEATFIGSGPTLEETQNILRSVSRVHFLGVQPHAELSKIFAEQDLLVLPSLSDICPNVVLEALCTGLPVVMTREHGLPHGMHGTIELSPTDERAWIETIRSLTEPAAYRALAASTAVPKSNGRTLVDLIV